jgi:2-polyprenyl-6-methoxyphenol hydroxylase-like FAD-dependent oxidoreductase
MLIDPHTVHPPELRCEKLGGEQLDLLRKTGLADATLRATTLDGEVWEARFGYVVAKKPSDQHGIMYDTLVNTMRAQIPQNVATIHAKASGISNGPERQKIALSNGEEISARLVVLANGLNVGLRHTLGIRRRVISECHSVTLGFDVEPVGRATFSFPALTYWPKRSRARMAYLSMFPIGGAMRANLMVYREMPDPWLQRFRQAPEETMRALMPGLQRMMGEFKVSGPVNIRPADLSSPMASNCRGSCWRAMRSRPPAPPQEPAPPRYSPTSGACATSTSRSGWRPTAWVLKRLRSSTAIRRRRRARRGALREHTAFVRCRPTTACHGAPGAGPVL